MSVEKIRSDCTSLPQGWSREEVIRKSGLSAGKTDVYYYSPDGIKFRSKPQLARHLGDMFDLSTFDFRTGRIIHSAIRKSKRMKGTAFDYARGLRPDANLILPIRQTASIFKQPVSVYRTRKGAKSRTDLKHGTQEQPKQLFWEKRLQGIGASDINEELFDPMNLPTTIQGVGPDVSTENVLQSIAAALHLNNQPVVGQTQDRSRILKNPGVHINIFQPLLKQVIVSHDDILRQEQKVNKARKQLEQVLTTTSLET